MPRLASNIYAAHQDGVLKLAAKSGGVSRPQIMEALNVSRSIADTMIEKCDLRVDRREGRTEFFILPNAAPSVPTVAPPAAPAPQEPEVAPLAEKGDELPVSVKEAGIVEPNPLDRLAAVVEPDETKVSALDREIAETRTALRGAATRAGQAMGEWATQQAMVDALREQIQSLVARRLALSA
jgi:hypothetical protein